MALKTKEKPDRPDYVKVCIKQESRKKVKVVRNLYSSKKTEIQVRKRSVKKEINRRICGNTDSDINTDGQYNLISKSAQSANIMFYPPCPQYYPITTNEWNPIIPIQCPLYTIQPIPVILNPSLLSTQICSYPPIIVPPVTVANEFPVSPLVTLNEFSLHVAEIPIVTTILNEPKAVCCAMPMVSGLSNGFSNLAACNEVPFPGTPLNSMTSFTADDVIPVATTPNEFSALLSFASCEISPIETTASDIFSPIQNIQVPNEFIQFCTTVSNDITPLSNRNYESLSYEYFECELPVFDESVHEAVMHENEHNTKNALEFYLSLPKDLFPTARMMTLDPNLIIDEFCKAPNVDDHSWILDLEFGVPKTPVNRRVATYNVKMNSIHCKNVPEAIHPGFERCDEDLKRVLMFYYDCVISNWYRGYITLTCDRSVENFQLWLLLPMQVLGMCWP